MLASKKKKKPVIHQQVERFFSPQRTASFETPQFSPVFPDLQHYKTRNLKH